MKQAEKKIHKSTRGEDFFFFCKFLSCFFYPRHTGISPLVSMTQRPKEQLETAATANPVCLNSSESIWEIRRGFQQVGGPRTHSQESPNVFYETMIRNVSPFKYAVLQFCQCCKTQVKKKKKKRVTLSVTKTKALLSAGFLRCVYPPLIVVNTRRTMTFQCDAMLEDACAALTFHGNLLKTLVD